MIQTIRQAADAFRRAYRILGFTKEEPGATLARAMIDPKTNAPVMRVNDSGELTGTAITALLATALAAAQLPPGVLAPYGGTAAPTGWILCYGQAVSRATYAALFTAISTTYGVGDGSTTFNLPDLRGRVVAGQDDMGGVSANRLTNQTGGVEGDTLGATGGAETHVLTEAQLAAHDHTAQLAAGTAILDAAGGGQYAAGSDAAGGTTGETGAGEAHNNVQPTIILNYIIKT